MTAKACTSRKSNPSGASLVTGQHAARLKMVRHLPGGVPSKPVHYWEGDPARFPVPNWMDTSVTTYAEALKPLGYYSHFVGKWHLGHDQGFHPVDHGFDSQYGTTNHGHPRGYNAPFFKDKTVFSTTNLRDHLAETLTDHTVDWINGYNKSQPFMLSFWLYNVHRPAEGKPEYVEHFKAKGLTGDMVHYAAQIKSVDDAVGRVRAALEKKTLPTKLSLCFCQIRGVIIRTNPRAGPGGLKRFTKVGRADRFLYYGRALRGLDR